MNRGAWKVTASDPWSQVCNSDIPHQNSPNENPPQR